MTSRRRSAPSSLSPPRISRWLITRTIIKICTLFHPLALSLTLFRFPSLFFFHFLCFTHFELFQRHIYSELQISLARHGRAVFTPLLSSHRRRRCRRSSFLFILLLFCFAEILNRAKRECASRRKRADVSNEEKTSRIS